MRKKLNDDNSNGKKKEKKTKKLRERTFYWTAFESIFDFLILILNNLRSKSVFTLKNYTQYRLYIYIYIYLYIYMYIEKITKLVLYTYIYLFLNFKNGLLREPKNTGSVTRTHNELQDLNLNRNRY